MDKQLQAELWENQIWMMWILAFLLLHANSNTEHIFGWIVLGWSAITWIGIITRIVQAKAESS